MSWLVHFPLNVQVGFQLAVLKCPFHWPTYRIVALFLAVLRTIMTKQDNKGEGKQNAGIDINITNWCHNMPHISTNI